MYIRLRLYLETDLREIAEAVTKKREEKKGGKRGKFLIDMYIAWDSSITRDKLRADRFQIIGKKLVGKGNVK